MYSDYDDDYEPGDEYDDDEGDRQGKDERDSGCDFCRQPIALGEGTYFQSYRGDDLWIHAHCLPQAQERNSQMQAEEMSDLIEFFSEDVAAAEEEDRRQNREYNNLWYRIASGWRIVSYLIRVRYRFDDLKDLEFLANCVLRQNLEYYRTPEWLAPRKLTFQQRQLMIAEADRAAEGSLTEEELMEMDDRELAATFLGALHDYCISQGFF